MSKILKVSGGIAGAHFASFSIIGSLLLLSGFRLFTLGSVLGISPPPQASPAQDVLFLALGILTYPLALLDQFAWIPWNWFTVPLGLGCNSALWGVSIALLDAGVKRSLRTPTT